MTNVININKLSERLSPEAQYNNNNTARDVFNGGLSIYTIIVRYLRPILRRTYWNRPKFNDIFFVWRIIYVRSRIRATYCYYGSSKIELRVTVSPFGGIALGTDLAKKSERINNLGGKIIHRSAKIAVVREAGFCRPTFQ